MARTEFSKKTKIEAFKLSDGRCEVCTLKITAANGPTQYDHMQAAALEGTSTLDNCQVLCKPCHDLKTFKPIDGDVPRIAKARRGYEKRANARDNKPGFYKPKGMKYSWAEGRYVSENEHDEEDV